MAGPARHPNRAGVAAFGRVRILGSGMSCLSCHRRTQDVRLAVLPAVAD